MDDGGSVRYLLNIAGTGLGNNNNSFTVTGIQTEMHSTNNRLVRQGPGSGGAHVVFNECNITATNGAREQVVRLDGSGDVQSLRADTEPGRYLSRARPGRRRRSIRRGGFHSFRRVRRSGKPIVFVQRAAGADGLAWGQISARGCFNNFFKPTEPRIERHAVDFDLNWYNGGRCANFPGLKTISVKPQNRSWPCVDADYDWVVTLPAHALIANIQVFRPANDGPAVPYTLHWKW